MLFFFEKCLFFVCTMDPPLPSKANTLTLFNTTHPIFLFHRFTMKRAASPTYFSDDDASDVLLAQALDEIEQTGGVSPLFMFDFVPVGQRRRWRNVVQGQSFRATLHQLRDARPNDNIGSELTEALRRAIDRELERQEVRPHDRVNFSMQAHGFAVAFQSVNFEVREFLERSLRLDTLLQSLANKLNSNQSFDPQQGFEVPLSVISMPTPGSRPTNRAVGRRNLEKVLKKKQCIISIKNRDQLCCARAIVTMRAHCHKGDDYMTICRWENLRKGLPCQTKEAKDLHRAAGVPEGPCGIEELKKFQAVLGTQYQLSVLSFCHPFMVIFKGPPAPRQICLVKADTHYHGCTSFPAFINYKSYFCLECEKGYDHDTAKDHSCKGAKCKSCNRKDCPDYRIGTLPTTRCPKCNGLFFGSDCLLFTVRAKSVVSSVPVRNVNLSMLITLKSVIFAVWPSVLLVRSGFRWPLIVVSSNRWISTLPLRVRAMILLTTRMLWQMHFLCMLTLRLNN